MSGFRKSFAVVSVFPGTTHIDLIFQNSRHIEAEKSQVLFDKQVYKSALFSPDRYV